MAYFTTEDGLKLFYEEYGKEHAEPVILLHGLACTHEYFHKQIEVLRKKYHVVAFDMRGNGKSDRICRNLTIEQCAKDVQDLITALDLRRPSILSWSFGVNVALSFVEQFGCANLSKIVLADNTPKMLCDETWQYGVFPDYKSMVGGFLFMSTNWGTYVAGSVPAFFGEGAEPDKEEFDWVFSRFSDNDPGCILTMFVNNSNGDVRGALPLIDVPVLLTHGSLPSYCTKEIMEAIGGMIRDSRVEEFYGGHLHMLQDAEHFNRVLMDFLEKGNPR